MGRKLRMPTFIIQQSRVYNVTYFIDAKDRVEAIAKVLSDKVDYEDDDIVFNGFDTSCGIPISNLTEEERKRLKSLTGLDFKNDIVESIVSIDEEEEPNDQDNPTTQTTMTSLRSFFESLMDADKKK